MSAIADSELVSLLHQAAQWRLASLLLEPPAGQWRAQVAALRREVADPLLKQAAQDALQQACPADYHTLFGAGGVVSLREVAYRPMADPGRLLAELAELYAAFGYRPNLAEAPDHLAMEAGFVAYLYLKQAFAQSCGQREKATLAQQAAAHFCREHLALLGSRLAAPLHKLGIEYLALAAQIIARQAAETAATPARTAEQAAGLRGSQTSASSSRQPGLLC